MQSMELSAQDQLKVIKKMRTRRRWVSFGIFVLCLLLVFNVEMLFGMFRGALHLGHINIHPVANLSFSAGVKVNEGQAVQLAGEKLIKAEGGKLQYLDRDGVLLWEKPYAGAQVIVKAMGKVIDIVEKDSGDFYVLDHQGGIQVKKEALGKVDRVIAEDDQIAILYKQLERKIMVLGTDGSLKSQIDLPYPDILDIAYIPEKQMIAVSVFFIEKKSFHTNVLLFGVDGKMKGARNFDSQVLYKLSGVKDRVIAIGDNAAMAFSTDKDELWKVPLDRVLSKVDLSEDGYSALNLVIENRDISDTRDENVILMLDPSGKKVFESSINSVVDSIKVRKDRVALIGDGKLMILDQKGRVIGEHAVGDSLRQMLWISQDLIGLEYEDHFEILSCKY